jgi:hypothetical protein
MPEETTAPAAPVTARGEDFTLEDRMLLRGHVINLNQGLLSGGGAWDNTPADVDAIFDSHLPEFIGDAQGMVRLVFYAHGGLVPEKGALRTALKHIRWWLQNRSFGEDRAVYPIYFVWETGFWETLGQLLAPVRGRLAERGVRDIFDYTTDPVIETAARYAGGVWIWGGMKGSALAASSGQGGATYAAHGLNRLLRTHGDRLELHAVGHSAGAIFHSHFVPMAADVCGRPFQRAYFLAPAVRVDTFKSLLMSRIGGNNPAVRELLTFTMCKDAERADHCVHVYRKSLLYLIHHALEKEGRVPILGLEESIRSDRELRELFSLTGVGGAGEVIWSPTTGGGGASATQALAHGAFDDDAPTMNSLLRRVCALGDGSPIHAYPPPIGRGVDELGMKELPEELTFLRVGGPFSFRGGGTAPRGGRRRALCVGINDYPRAPLAGCVADAHAWASTLQGLGFEAPRVLTDADATRERLIQELDLLLQTSRAGDTVVFQFSGHGTYAPDASGDEADGDSPGQDEALCPYDYDQGRLLVDDDLGVVLARAPEGVAVTCFLDCCHSGTATRFGVGRPLGREEDERTRFLRLTAEDVRRHQHFRRTLGGRVIRRRGPDAMREVVFSACLSVEVALESNGHGHFTLHATRVLRQGDNLSNEEFQARVTAEFGAQPRQHPYLDCAPAARPLLLFTGGGAALDPWAGAPPAASIAPPAAAEARTDVQALARALRAAADALEGR